MAGPELTQTYEPNPILGAVFRRLFEHIRVDDAWAQKIRQLSQRGRVVYVLRNLNIVDFLALDYLTRRHDLPRIRFVNDLGLWILNPLGKGWLNAILPKRHVQPQDELEDALSRGGSAALFLKRPPGVLDVAAGATRGLGLKDGDELVRALFDLQRRHSEPILLVPQLFLWSKVPDKLGTDTRDLLLGLGEWPTPLRAVAQFFYNYKHVSLRAGEPLDLQAFLAESEGQSDTVTARRLTYAMLRRLERERRAVTGPAEKPSERVRLEIVQSPRLRSVIDDLVDEHTDRYTLQTRALGMLEELQARPDRTTVKVLELVFDRLFQRIYAGVEYDAADIERLREAAKRGTLVLLPSHKSHIDYLILSYIFNMENLPLPIIAAGDNLNFFPAGGILRRGGGFFIRRSFRGDRLYAAVVDAYVRRLIRDGYPIELFLEGGRSRTGKLVPPKFGLLSMIVDAALAVPSTPSYFVPVSIGYERVIEGEAYERELKGGEKAKEDAAGLLKSGNLLRHRYGRINMQVGQILSLSEITSELSVDTSQLSPVKRRNLVTRIGNRVMDEINRVTAVTPGALTALVLLSHDQRGLSHTELVGRSRRLLEVLRQLGARTSPALVTPAGNLRTESLREAAQLFVDGDLVELHHPDREPEGGRAKASHDAFYVVPHAKRLLLDTTKNIIVHFFVERALVALALLSLAQAAGDPTATEGIAREDVRERVRELSRLFKHEFRFRADAPFEQIFEETLQQMTEMHELATEGDRLRAGPGRDGCGGYDVLLGYAAMLKNFLEGYRIAARSLRELLERSQADKEMLKKALSLGQHLFLEGDLSRSEAVSRPILSCAYAAFADQGYVIHRESKYHPGPELTGPAAIEALEQRIRNYTLERKA
ncbi:MAG TPA: 1-acyl-sn-glycerol-3-phosphate acyltransferase [Polyangiaceae bacterium]|nr:1-acyl-sn-glycerol-3-phosphate acyltransferase [Polyangiaceae bacterium]